MSAKYPSWKTKRFYRGWLSQVKAKRWSEEKEFADSIIGAGPILRVLNKLKKTAVLMHWWVFNAWWVFKDVLYGKAPPRGTTLWYTTFGKNGIPSVQLPLKNSVPKPFTYLLHVTKSIICGV